jgi:hypothetical protein
MRWSGILAFIIKEFKELVPPTVFFAVGFNIIALTMQLVLDDYFVRFASFIVVTSAALVVGKAVLVANALPFLGRFDRAPLIQPILFKTAIYFVVVLVVQILERIVEYLLGGGTMAGISKYVSENWHRFTAVQIWIFVLFLIYVTTTELNALLGDGELVKILFTRPSSDLRQTRRQRIRTLVNLSRLTDAHSLDELQNPDTAAHRELVNLIGGLEADEKSK